MDGKIPIMCFKVVLFLLLFKSSSCYKKMCSSNDTVDISSGTQMSNGDVYFKGIKYDQSEYYIDKTTGSIRGCACLKNMCLRKCCPFGLGYHIKKKQCVNVTEIFQPPVFEHRMVKNQNGTDDIEFVLMNSVVAKDKFQMVFGKVNCVQPEYRVRISQLFSRFHLLTNGHLYIDFSEWKDIGPDKYCIDTFLSESENGDIQYKLDALVCFPEAESGNENYFVSSTCMLISCVFILATVAVYMWLPELRNVHGRVLTAYLLCLFVGFIFMSTMQILLLNDNISQMACVIMTFVIYFFLMSAFFWMNVMSFDIWWTFSGKRRGSEKKSTRLCKYAAYAFGVPTALTIIVASLEFADLEKKSGYLPLIREQGCFLAGTGKTIYFYMPIVILCVANIFFFFLTALKIREAKRQAAGIKTTESALHDQQRNENNKQRLFLYVKLFILMGISWLLEVASGVWPDMNKVWMFTDAYNVLIGVIIFIIFVCKRKIVNLMKKRIKQQCHQRSSVIGDIKQFNSNGRSNWRNCNNQRASLDTIRTYVLDTDDSMKAMKTTQC